MAGRAVALALLFLLGAPLLASARHGGVLLDARHGTPGTQLELVEIPATPPSMAMRFHVHATNISSEGLFGIWTKDFGASFRQVLGRLRVARDGMVVAALGNPPLNEWERVVLEPGPYSRGAAWEVGLVSADGTVMAFTRIIPRPIAARNGACSVSLELASRRGDKFLVSGTGFAPAEEVTIESNHGGQILQKRQKALGDGQLPPDVVAHRPDDADHRAQYTVKGRTCAVVLDYEWGDPASVRR